MAINPYDGAGYGCGIGYGYCGAPVGGATALDILASVGTSTSPTTATTKKIALPFEAKAFLPFACGGLASDAAVTNVTYSVGAMTADDQMYVAVSSQNGVTTSNTDRRHHNASATSYFQNGVVYEEASRSLIESDGVTLNWTTAGAYAAILNHIALGGADLEVSLTQYQMNGTNADESFAHGLSGAPTGLLFFSAIDATSPPNTLSTLFSSIGAWSSSSQFAASMWANNGMTTSRTTRILSSGGVVNGVTSAPRRQLTVDAVDGTNVNCSYTTTFTATQHRFYMLAIRGAKCQTGTFDCNGSTDPLTISCAGITPKLWVGFGVPGGVDSVNTVQNDARLSLMASDGTNNVSCGITDANGVTTTNARRWQDSNSLAEYNTAGTLEFDATATFDGESVIIDPTTCSNTTIGQGAYLIIGA